MAGVGDSGDELINFISYLFGLTIWFLNTKKVWWLWFNCPFTNKEMEAKMQSPLRTLATVYVALSLPFMTDLNPLLLWGPFRAIYSNLMNAPPWIYAGWFFSALIVGGILVAIHEEEERERVSRIKQGRCLDCGYDLRASPQRCPECGLARTN